MSTVASSRRERAAVLAMRREALVALAQVQREAILLHSRGLTPSLNWIERGRQAWAVARAHPWIVLVCAGALAWLRPRWATRATATLLALQRIEQLLR